MEGIEMKRYKLLKDMPTIKAGTVFVSDGTHVTQVDCDTKINIEDILNFSDWFEEWKPQYGETYKFMHATGVIARNDYGHVDGDIVSIGNCYPLDTPDELIIKEQKLIPQAIHRLRMAAKKAWFEFNGSKDWDMEFDAYYIASDLDDGSVRVCTSDDVRAVGVVYFPTEESAQWVIDNMLDELKLVMGIE